MSASNAIYYLSKKETNRTAVDAGTMEFDTSTLVLLLYVFISSIDYIMDLSIQCSAFDVRQINITNEVVYKISAKNS